MINTKTAPDRNRSEEMVASRKARVQFWPRFDKDLIITKKLISSTFFISSQSNLQNNLFDEEQMLLVLSVVSINVLEKLPYFRCAKRRSTSAAAERSMTLLPDCC